MFFKPDCQDALTAIEEANCEEVQENFKENAKSADKEPCKDRNRLRSYMPAINRTGKKNKPFNWKKEHCIGIGSTCNDRNCFLGIWTKNSLLNLGLCLIVFC